MASALEQRLIRVETLLQTLSGQVGQLRDLVGQLQQQQYAPGGGFTGGGGGGASVCFANNLTLGAATGTWPSITPTSTTADVYKIVTGALVLVTAGATIYNFLPSATDSAKRQVLGVVGDGTFTVISQSCDNG